MSKRQVEALLHFHTSFTDNERVDHPDGGSVPISEIEQELAKDRTEALADDISSFVNSMNQSGIKELGIAMCKDHRTLVQSKMRFVMSYLSELSDLYANGFYDARNEQACKIADKMLSALSEFEKDLPFI